MSRQSAHQWTVEDFDLLQIVCMDISGLPRGKVIPRDVARKVVEKKCYEQILCLHAIGHACDLPLSVPEIMGTGFDNGLWVPMMDTLVELAWVSRPQRRVGQLLGHILQEDGQPEPTTVRFQVDRQLKKLEMMGYTMTSSFGCQFTTFKAGTEYRQFLGSDDRNRTSPYNTIGIEELMFDTCDVLQRTGIDVDSWSRREGRGAFEISLGPAEGLKSVDMASRLKQGVRSIMNAQGYDATFMTRPADADVASVFTFRFTIRNLTGQSAFYDAAKEDKISDLARHWLAGMISHGAAMTALFRPTVNCYHGYANYSGIQTPKRLDWGIDSASTFLSVHVTGSEVSIETRMPSSACNPYFVMLATLVAGTDGVEKKMTCPSEQSSDAAPAPATLAAALDALGSDNIIEEAMSPLLMKVFVALKRDEITKFKDLEGAENKEEKIRTLEKNLYLIRL